MKTKKAIQNIKHKLQKIEKRALKNPFKSLGLILLALFAIIVLNSYLRTPDVTEELALQPIPVQTYSIGETPRITVSGTVNSSNVITVVAQSSGVVRTRHVSPGQKVYRGQQLISLSTDYYGNNISYLQSQLAQQQYDTTVENYDAQKETVALQRELAEKQADNSEELRKITEQSISETEELLELNESILSDINTDLETATESATISQLNSQKTQILSVVNQIKSGLRQTKYQADSDSAVQQLSTVSKDLTLKQLEIQERSLELSLAAAEIQLKIARAQAALMNPGSPVSGIVEDILVNEYQFVSPGTPLAVISTTNQTTEVIAYVSADLAKSVSLGEPSILISGNTRLEVYPHHVSTTATRGSLHSVTFIIPVTEEKNLTNQSVISMSLPIAAADTNAVIPFLPLESIHQSELESTVYVVSEDNTVTSKRVELGTVSGRFISILNGLESGDRVILDRSVTEGQLVSLE